MQTFRIIGDCTYTEHSFIAWLVTKLMSLRPEWQSEVNSAVKTHSYQSWFLLPAGLTKSTQTRPEMENVLTAAYITFIHHCEP